MKRTAGQRWRRRLLVLTLLAVAGRAALALLLPWLIDVGAQRAGLTATLRSASLSLLGLSFRVQDLRLCDAHSGACLLQVQDLGGDVSAWQLLHGEWVVVDAWLAGGRLELSRRADGTLALPAAWTDASAEATATPPAPARAERRLDLPFLVRSARVHDLHVALRDAAKPWPGTAVELDAEVVDLGHRDHPGRVELRVHSPGLCDRLQFQASVAAAAERLAVEWVLTGHGLRTAALAERVDLPKAALDVLGAADAALDLRGNLVAVVGAAPPREMVLSADLAAAVRRDGRDDLRLSASFGPTAAVAGGQRLPFRAEVHGAGLADAIELRDGSLEVAAERLRLQANLDGRAVHLRALAPHLAQLGLSIAPGGLAVAASMQADLPRQQGGPFALQVRDVTVAAGQDRFHLASAAIADARATPTGIHLGAITAVGPHVLLQRAPDGALTTGGITFRPAAAAPATADAVPGPAAVPAADFTVGRLDWRAASLHFHDASAPAQATVAELSLRGEDLGLRGGLPIGHAELDLRVPDAIGALRLDLRAEAGPGGADLTAQLLASDLRGGGLTPWLAPLGVAVPWRQASLAFAATAQVGRDGPFTTVDGTIANLRLADGDEPLLVLRSGAVRGLRTGPSGPELGTLRLDELLLAVHAGDDGPLRIAGVHAVQATHPADAPAPAAQPAAPPAPAAPTLRLEGLAVAGATVRWHGPSPTDQPIDLNLEATLGSRRGDGAPTPFAVTLRAAQAFAALELRGQWGAGGHQQSLAAELSGRGIGGAGLDALLPASIHAPLRDGTLRARLTAQTHGDGARRSLDIVVADAALHDAGEELLGIDELALHAPELSANLLHIAALRVRGLRGVAAATDAGLHVAGLLLRQAPRTAAAPEAQIAAAPTPPTLPALRIDALELDCRRFMFRDRRGGEGEPLDVALQARLEAPWATAAVLEDSLPMRLTAEVRALPLCRELRATAAVQPFRLAPQVDLDLLATGIDPTALARLAPATAQQVLGTTNDASLRASVHAEVDLRRRDARLFDVSRPFGANVSVENLLLRDESTGVPLFAVESLDVAARAIDLRTGDVLLASVDIDGPVLTARRTSAGLVVGGILLPAAAAGAGASTAAAAPPAPAAAGPVAELAIDHLRVQGLAFDWRDETTTPPTHLPVQDLDLEAHRLSNRLVDQPRQFSFDLRLRGGDVQLDRRIVRSSLVAGVLGAAGEALAGQANVHTTELRPLVDEVAVAGQLQVYPVAKGSLLATVRAFELPALRGLARRAGVEITDGLFDTRLDVQMRGAAGTDVRDFTTFTWLSLSEPPGGPISTWLKLPAPLDTVLFLLRNDADEQRLPLQMHLPAEGVRTSTLVEAVAEALALAIGEAVGRSPLRAMAAVTDLFGTGAAAQPGPRAVCTFQGGQTLADLAALPALLAATRGDPAYEFVLTHELSAADLDAAARLANPPADTVSANVARLRARHAELTAGRNGLAAATAAAHAAGQVQLARAQHADLQSLDTAIGELEATLGEALAMLDATTARAAARRARAAALAIGEARLDAVAAALRARVGPDGKAAIVTRRPRAIAVPGLDGGGRVAIEARLRRDRP